MTDGAPRRPPRRTGRGRHRPGFGLLRTRHHPLGARRDRLRHRPRRAQGPGDGRHRPACTATRTRPTSPPRSSRSAHAPDAQRHRSGTSRCAGPARPGRSSTTSTGSPATDPACFAAGPHDAAAARAGQAGDAASTSTRSTSSPTAGSSTTPSSATRSATTPHPSTTRSPRPSSGTATPRADHAPPSRPLATTDHRRSNRLSQHDHDQRTNHEQRTRPADSPPSAWPAPPASPSPASPPSARSSTTPRSSTNRPPRSSTPYREHQGAVTAWFLVLVISAALLAPVGLLLGRLAGGRLGRWIAVIGVAAATVQVIGLSRWVLFVPRVSDDALVPGRAGRRPPHLRAPPHLARQGARRDGRLRADRHLHGARRDRRSPAPLPRGGWPYLGYVSAGLIATGVFIPLGVERRA